LVLTFQPGYGQDKKEQRAEEVTQMVESQRFSFRAQSVLPLRGRSRQLTSDYRMKILKDSVICDLPYFGRSQNAPLDPSETGLQFTSTNFQYTKKDAKKGGWDITIVFNDVKEPRRLSMSISPSGYASMQVPGTNRDPIAFNGEIIDVSAK
jgi:hypothetical protein